MNKSKKPPIKLSMEFITPKVAAEWLGHNVHNRNISQVRVNKYAGAILRDEYRPTGQAIEFNGTGDLLNGQHRLLSVIKADEGIWSAVARNVESDAQEVMDIGAPRKLGDILQLRGEPNATTLAAALRATVQYRNTGIPLTGSGGSPVTPQQALSELDRHPEMRDCVREAKGLLSRDRTIPLPPGLTACFRFLFGEAAGDETALRWLAELEVPIASPMLTLKRRLARQQPGAMLHPKMRSALVIKGWNAWLFGETPKVIQWKPGGGESFPEILSDREESTDE